jgi:hypothetical protein
MNTNADYCAVNLSKISYKTVYYLHLKMVVAALMIVFKLVVGGVAGGTSCYSQEILAIYNWFEQSYLVIE